MLLLLALLVGVVAGLRAMTAPAITSWAARLGWLAVGDTPFRFMGGAIAPIVFAVLAVAEIVNDKRASTPSRKIPAQFGARIASGGFCGAVIGATHGVLVVGAALGVVGAVIGTLGGSAARGALGRVFGKDLPAALLEDAIAVGGGMLLLLALT